MTNMFLSFLEISIPISLIIVLLLLLTPVLNKRYAAKWKYWIWIVLTLRLIIPLGENGRQPVADMQPQMADQGRSESEIVPPDMLDNGTVQRRVIVEIPAQITTPITVQSEKNSSISMLDIMTFIWIFGSLLFISVHLINYFHYKHQIFKKGKIVKDRDALYLLLNLKHELHIKCTVPVVEYSEAASPMLIGFFNHVLVLPGDQYNSEELFFILKHELIHLKRGDIYFKLLFVVANAVHWYNPLVWFMHKEAVVDMELSCDERVTQGSDYATRKAYTETLLSTLHKQSVKKTVLSTEFYGGKRIMKKRFKNILAKTRKKNGLAVLICAIILTVSMGTMVGCSIAKESAEDVPGQPETEDTETRNIQAENIQAEEPLPESGSSVSGTEQITGDYSVSIGNFTISLYEDKQAITDKLNENGLSYNEYDSRMKYSDTVYNKYDSYYMVGESPLGTDGAQWVDASLCAYFADGICVRLELLNQEYQTARGIHKDDSYSQLVEQYGDSFEKQAYNAHGIYDVYRYSYNEYICEFAILRDYPDSVQSVDIYVPSLYPIYDYGEELTN